MIFSRLALVVGAALALAACNPPAPEAAKPLSPQLAGWWSPKPERCHKEALRFDRERIVMRRDKGVLPVFDIRKADITGGGVELELQVAEAAAFESVRSAANAEKLAQSRVMVALTQYDNRLTLRDIQIRDDKGLRVPTRSERASAMKIFNFTRCPV